MKPFINKIGKISGNLSFSALSNYVSKYSIDAILTDSDRKTLWIDGYPYGYGFYQKKTVVSSIVPTGDAAQTYWNSIVLNDYGTNDSYGNIAIGNYSLASGSLTRAIGNYSTAEGYETWAVGDQSHAEGILSIALAASSHAEGYSNTFTSAVLAHAENASDAKGKLSHAEGYKTIADGDISHAEGEYTWAYGWGSHAEGYGTETGDNTVNNLNTDNISIVSNAIKNYLSDTSSVFYLNSDITVSIDRDITATTTIYTVTNDDDSTDITDSISYPVIGFTTATAVPFPGYPGYYAHAEGVTTRAKALGSHTEGFNTETTSNALFSHAEGIGTKTTNYGEHTEGKYNYSIESDDDNKGTIHTIGIGTGEDDANRKNAVRVDTDGAVYLCGIIDNDGNDYNPCDYDGQAPNEHEISLQEILAKSQIKWVSKTYNDVKKDIENNALIEGAFYKINDYTTVINSSNYDDIEVTSNSNPFDVIVLATANNRLSETAWAMQNDNSGDRGLGNDIDVDGSTVTSFINIYEDRTFIPKYYYRNSLGFITYYTPTNNKILSFKNNFKTIDGETTNSISYPALSTTEYISDDNTPSAKDIYVLDGSSLIDNKGSITWKSNAQIEIDEGEYFKEFTLVYKSSLLKTGESLNTDNIILTLKYSLDTTEVINGERYYKYTAFNAATKVDPADSTHKPSDFYIYDFSPYNSVYCKDYIKHDIESFDISVSEPVIEPGKPPIYPANPLFIKSSSSVGVEMTELFWEYTNSIKRCNSISLQDKITDELTTNTNLYFDTTDQVSIRKIINDNGVEYVIISAYYSLSYFDKCNLNSWELKYCIDNDTNRFDWADLDNGKGVIYYMKDEWGNECPYDFKNIKFNGKFTFTGGDSTDMSLYGLASQNSIKPYLFSNIKYRLNNITFETNGSVIGNTFGPNCYNCTFSDIQSTTDIGYLFNEFKGGNNGITDDDVNV